MKLSIIIETDSKAMASDFHREVAKVLTSVNAKLALVENAETTIFSSVLRDSTGMIVGKVKIGRD